STAACARRAASTSSTRTAKSLRTSTTSSPTTRRTRCTSEYRRLAHPSSSSPNRAKLLPLPPPQGHLPERAHQPERCRASGLSAARRAHRVGLPLPDAKPDRLERLLGEGAARLH